VCDYSLRRSVYDTASGGRPVSACSHLFEESGALEEVAQLAQDWSSEHLAPVSETPER
jgi:hypothetical protein